jgi:hypothetical protein
MIITLNSFWRGFSPLSNLNIKLPSFTVLERKERKEDTQCVPGLTEIYGSLQGLLRPSYTAFHPVVDIKYDPFSDLLVPLLFFDWRTLRSSRE